MAADYQFVPLTEITGTSSPYADIMSNLQDQAGPDAAQKFHEFLKTIQPAQYRHVTSAFARIVSANLHPVDYRYVSKDARGKAAIEIKPISHNAPIAQALMAARLHNAPDVSYLTRDWKDGRRSGVDMLNGGFPTEDPHAVATEYMADFANLRAAAAIGGKPNPLTSVHIDWIRKNHEKIKTSDANKLAQNYSNFAQQAAAQLKGPIGEFAKRLYATPSGIKDTFEGPTAKAEFTALCIQSRTIAQEALKNGRQSRREDNPPPLTAPWYRFPGATKAVNRLAFVLATTGGAIKTTTSQQVSAAFGVTDDGWHVFMDNDVPLETLFAKLSSTGLMTNGKLHPKVLVQVNVFAPESAAPIDKLFGLLVKNTWHFGWAIHDGYIFLTGDGGQPANLLPKMFGIIAAVNNLRTLHAHAPFVDIADVGVLGQWYGQVPDAKIPSGVFTGTTFDIDFESSKKQKMDGSF